MNIAVFIKNTTHHSLYGGLETQNETLCSGLAARGHNVVVFTPKKDVSHDTLESNGVLYVFVPCEFRNFNLFFSHKQTSWANRSIKYFKEYSSNNKFDIVISQSSAGMGIIKNKSTLKIKVISVAHGSKIGEARSAFNGLSSLKSYIRFLFDIPHVLYAYFISQRFFILNSNEIIAVSNYVKQAIISETFVSETKVTVVKNGINPSVIEGLAKSVRQEQLQEPKKLKFIYIGRVLKEKGLFLLIDAINMLAEVAVNFPESVSKGESDGDGVGSGDSVSKDIGKGAGQLFWDLTIVGSGKDIESLKKYVKTLGLESKVRFLGHLDYQSTLKELSGSDIFVFPTIRVEGLPMVLVEAMFFKKAIIASDIGGVSDAISANKTGLLTPPGDVEQLVHSMSSLIKNPKERNRLSENAKIKAYKEFTDTVMLDNYENVIKRVLGQ